MSVEDFHDRHGHLHELVHVLNIAPKGGNPHCLSRNYGAHWFVSRFAHKLGIQLRASKKTAWGWLWQHIGVLEEDEGGITARAKKALLSCFPDGPLSFFKAYGLAAHDASLLAPSLCFHKEWASAATTGSSAAVLNFAWGGR